MGLIAKAARAVGRLLHWRYRSSITGKFVPRNYAESHPDTTQRERAE